MPTRARHGQATARRLVVWLLFTTVVPASALAGLGWALVREDRARETERRRDAREHAATLAATALQRTLAELEDQLSSLSVGQPSPPGAPRADVAIITFDRVGTSSARWIAAAVLSRDALQRGPAFGRTGSRRCPRVSSTGPGRRDRRAWNRCLVNRSRDASRRPASSGSPRTQAGAPHRRARSLRPARRARPGHGRWGAGGPARDAGASAGARRHRPPRRRATYRVDTDRRSRSRPLDALAGAVHVCPRAGGPMARRAHNGCIDNARP